MDVYGAALMDSLLCADDSFKRVQQYMSEMQRVLKPGGVLLVISFAPPESRLPFLKARGLTWEIEHSEIGASRARCVCVLRASMWC